MDLVVRSWPVLLGLFGLLFGSFANVVVWRLPRGESVVSPGSRCPACGRPIRWYDNIPVVSWAVLRARCRDCGAPISWRYPLVEALSGVLWTAAGLRFGFSPATAACLILFHILLILTFIDIDTRRLPNLLVGTLAVVGVTGALAAQSSGARVVPLVGQAPSGAWASPLVAALGGALIGAGVSAAIAGAYGALRGRAGLGAGDVKLLGAMGLFTGPYVLMALVLGSIAGSVAGILGARRSGGAVATHKIPFGPFLALGCAATVLAGPALWGWYLSLFAVQ